MPGTTLSTLYVLPHLLLLTLCGISTIKVLLLSYSAFFFFTNKEVEGTERLSSVPRLQGGKWQSWNESSGRRIPEPALLPTVLNCL